MDMIEIFLNFVEEHLNILLTLGGLLFAWYTYCKEVKSALIKKLAKQIIAYYCVEQEAIKKIRELTPKTEQTIQRELRKRAINNENNLESVRPEMSAASARKLL